MLENRKKNSQMDIKDKNPREGVRGGREQFRWDSLKSQSAKQRGNYLGYTTKVGMIGKFGQNQRNDWWLTNNSESSNVADSRAAEKARVKSLEEELMHEALGTKPKRLLLSKSKLSSDQVGEILKKEQDIKQEVPVKKVDPKKETIKEDADESKAVVGLGYRKYLKPSDWAEDLDEDIVILQGENFPYSVVPKEEPRERSRSR